MGTTAKPTGYCRDFMVADVEFRKAGGRMSPDLAATHYGALLYPSEVLGDDALWATIRQSMLDTFKDRDSELLIAQWQACIDFDCEDELRTCQVPIHVIGFSEDMQAPPALGKRVAELAPNGHFHLLARMGHLSMMGHREREVNEAILAILQLYT
jgi:pimeloyl-ACP methyl ester carboxylesterase